MNEKKMVAAFLLDGIDNAANNALPQSQMRNFAREHDLIIDNFIAIDDSDKSSGAKAALSSAIKNNCRFIIFGSPQALSLNSKDLFSFLKSLEEKDILLGFLQGNIIYQHRDTSIFAALLENAKHQEQLQRSAKIKASLQKKKRAGKKLGGRKFGADPKELRIVNQILKLHSDGLSFQKICELLALNDIKTVQKKSWHPTTVKRIVERFSR